jgi:hypothetical protein
MSNVNKIVFCKSFEEFFTNVDVTSPAVIICFASILLFMVSYCYLGRVRLCCGVLVRCGIHGLKFVENFAEQNEKCIKGCIGRENELDN